MGLDYYLILRIRVAKSPEADVRATVHAQCSSIRRPNII
jgi:hypothetical protein